MDVARLCSSLVRIRSENPPGNTAEAVEYIQGFLDTLGVQSTVVRSHGGRANLVSEEADARLLLCGHLDVVPALPEGWRHDPFSGAIEDGYVWGRGSTDMKGGCAALLSAYKECVDAGGEPKVRFAFVCDEETGGEYGIRYLLAKNLLQPCDCLIAEPTPPLCPAIGQKGLCRLEMRFRGEPGHGSLYPRMGRSAIMEAYALLEYLHDLHGHEFVADGETRALIERSMKVLEETLAAEGQGDILTRIMYNPGCIEGGEKANIVAQHCTMELDVRVPWGCSTEHLIGLIADRAENATLRVLSVFEPTLTPPDTLLVTALCAEIERVHAAPASPIFQWAASDARYLRNAGFSVADYGPGEIDTLHAVDERTSIAGLEKAVDVYRGLIAAYSS
ncbi:acetylornithine deacetylase [hydrocarbon metagenome]|uniref:Probable succinyl-diaminopimelate desuccinylase n=1 Tax=hydrocarbon metagenome TaxID=938273 RepID=A0A0W8FK92_9ZZZZ|nr:ArgE/DapE family deacylase [Methanomicrobiaceae archaeon]